MNGTEKRNKTITEKFFEYFRYHPVSGILTFSVIIGYAGVFALAILLNMPYVINYYFVIYSFLFWFPSIPVALKTKNKYSIYTAIAPAIILLFLFAIYLFARLFFEITKININLMQMTKEQPVILSLIILVLVFGFFAFLIYLLIKYQKSDMWIQSLWVQKGGVIVNTAEKIYSTQDGYSERPYSYQMKISDLNFSDIENFSKLLAKNLIIINWKNRENSIKMWLLVRKNFIEYLDIFYSENLGSWIEINKEGKLTVFIAKPDYKNIYREVTYHTLCQMIAEKFEQSFIEFAKDSKDNKIYAIKILRGEK